MIALEHIAPEDWGAVEHMRQVLQSLVIDTGGRSVGIRFGTNSGTWPGGSPRANNDTVSHGLGTTPKVVVATVTASPSGTWFPVVATVSYGATTFSITAVTSDGSSPAAATSYSVAWVAIG